MTMFVRLRGARAAALGIALTASALCPARVFAQQGTPATITVTGAVSQPLTLTAADLAKLPRASVSTSSQGITTVYEGVWLSEILKKAGLPYGDAHVRGMTLAGYVLASASDGYQVLFSLGEVDPNLTDSKFLVADQANGKPLFGENGSFRLVIPTDKAGARSIRMLTSLTVVQLRK